MEWETHPLQGIFSIYGMKARVEPLSVTLHTLTLQRYHIFGFRSIRESPLQIIHCFVGVGVLDNPSVFQLFTLHSSLNLFCKQSSNTFIGEDFD